ncbi:MAG: DUF2252 domain-containing protein [Actinobacteria bacterium]|jgi:uncharacterized protein (DUF2252 family)|nr:DUF2252 domain-containing protein [Micrococcales bacterium]MCB0903417.1 DUF2252 domain-containing protein [Actinomycetota bacterium]MCO5299209.1 DUF2252 domain-containing protein [Candidatus Nanopelagicales bacterium]MCB9429520.1 DUF2252 domain-containing protein [Actinomycetota bacterium]HPE11678.1 DUF2252 domain-containing protein [Actinomycetota bacterium]
MDRRLTVDERRAAGRQARADVPLDSHAEWTPRPDRHSPVAIIQSQNEHRVPWLLPIRHARMGVSPFTFYRGAAAIMAEDLSSTPDSGLWVQAGGDAHLANFGAYASPSRQLVFDANDFDETLPAPWEWDLKRLVASLVIAADHFGAPEIKQRRLAAHAVHAYRTAMQNYADEPTMDIWYAYLTAEDIQGWKGLSKEEMRKRLERFSTKARSRTSLQALAKLTTTDSGHLRIKSQPPLLWPLDEVPTEYGADEVQEKSREVFSAYVATTDDHIQALLSRFKLVDVGLKVVGVGSVGTRCFIVLLEGRDSQDPLFLQVKEAGPSVLEDHLQPSIYEHQGRRVVEGQRMIQAQTDIFLGWTTGNDNRHFYVRQLRDWKGSANLESGTYKQLRFYADLCAQTMARGHARSGDPIAIAQYMGTGTELDEAVAEFAMRYAAQNHTDYAAFEQAIRDGVLPAAETGY